MSTQISIDFTNIFYKSRMYRNYKTINKYKSFNQLPLTYCRHNCNFRLFQIIIAKNFIACKVYVNLFPIHFSYISLKFHPYVCTKRPALICVKLLESEFRNCQRFVIDHKKSLSFFKLTKKERDLFALISKLRR